MIKRLSKYRSLVAAVFVIAPLLIWFSYSELGQIVGEKGNPTQDYCEIVKVTKAETSKISLSDLFKLKVEKAICILCIDEISAHITSYNNSDVEQFHSPQKTTQIYLYNQTFLI